RCPPPVTQIGDIARLNHALLGPRPYEASALQPFGVQAQPVAIPPQQLDQITAATAKAEYVPGERSYPCLCRQAVKPLAHVSGAGRSHSRCPPEGSSSQSSIT